MTCVNCGKCCTFTNGAPYLTPDDVNKWLEHDQWGILNQIRFTIDKTHMTQEWTFFEHPEMHVCCFRIDGRCAIYKSRPLACQYYPGVRKCHSGHSTVPSIHVQRAYTRAWKDWQSYGLESRKENLKLMLEEARLHGKPLYMMQPPRN